MRPLPTEFAASLADGVTTLCWCWRVTRADAVVIGFTDHDRTLSFEGVEFRAASARSAGSVENQTGFAPGAAAVAGVLEDDAITSDDIANGLYDGARVELLRVDWSDPSSRVRVWSGFLGDVTRGELGFEAELRGRQATLERGVGRVFQRRCDAVLGDARCTVDLDVSAFRATAVVSGLVGTRAFLTNDLSAFTIGWFTRGALLWTSGSNAGARSEIEAHRAGSGTATIELLTSPAAPIAVADGFIVEAGCDKRWSTCRTKFDNAANFRGFPMIPGDDWLAAGPTSGSRNDGGSLWTDRET